MLLARILSPSSRASWRARFCDRGRRCDRRRVSISRAAQAPLRAAAAAAAAEVLPPIDSKPTPLPQAQQDALVQRARDALRAGRAAEAIELSEKVLAGSPDNQAAITVKVDAMIALGDLRGALRAYDGFVSATGVDHVRVIAPIARAQLKVLSQATLAAVKIDALEALAGFGDAEAKTTLQKLMKDETWPVPRSEAMARLGDKAAAQRVVQQASQAQGGQRVGCDPGARDDQGCAGRGGRARGVEGRQSGAAGGRGGRGGGARHEDAAAGAARDGGQGDRAGAISRGGRARRARRQRGPRTRRRGARQRYSGFAPVRRGGAAQGRRQIVGRARDAAAGRSRTA